jgi:hypothetical protein
MNNMTKDKAQEVTVATIKGGISLIPGIGPIAAEVLGTYIPNRRMERVEKMLCEFAIHVSGHKPEYIQERMKEDDFINLFEQAAYDAAKSKEENRLRAIGKILSSGVNINAKIAQAEKYLSIIRDLDDLDLLLLCSIEEKNNRNILERNVIFEDPYDSDYSFSECVSQALIWNGTPDINDEDVESEMSGMVEHSIFKLKSFGLVFERESYAEDKAYFTSFTGSLLMAYFQ